MNPTNVPNVEDEEDWQYVPRGMTEQELEENIKNSLRHTSDMALHFISSINMMKL